MDVSLAEALRIESGNKASRWLGRGADNRLEPECWPALTPSFQFDRSTRIFTIGSCFARNIENYLHAEGFRVTSLENSELLQRIGGFERHSLNKYTPPSILQELTWADRIRRRDGVVAEADVLPLLFEVSPGKYCDMHSRIGEKSGVTLEAALETRRAIYAMLTAAFESELAVITLGLVEAWWDTETEAYVEFDPRWAKLAPERFTFRKLTFAECYAHVRAAVDLLAASGVKHFLITTSPVPNRRTFTAYDAIIANTYSKSVLRAVAGQVCDEVAAADYFPSYESVMLTKGADVWQGDLAHVRPEFIARIMLRVVEHYAAATRAPAGSDDGLMAFAGAVTAGELDRARAAYAEHEAAILACPHDAVQVAAARLWALGGRPEPARLHLAKVDESRLEATVRVLFEAARVYAALGDATAAARLEARYVELARLQPLEAKDHLTALKSDGRETDFQHLLALVDAAAIASVNLTDHLARWRLELDQAEDALRLYRRELDNEPDNVFVLSRLARLLLKQEQLDEAILRYARIVELTPRDLGAQASLVRCLRKRGDLAAAERACAYMLEVLPDSGLGHAIMSNLLWRRKEAAAARAHAARARALAPDDPVVLREVRQIA